MSSGEINRIPQFSGLEPEYETKRPPHRQKMDGSACQTLLRALVDHTGPSRPCFIQPIRRTRSPGALGPPPGPGLSRPGVYTTAYCMVRPTTCFKVRVLPTIYGYYVLHTCSRMALVRGPDFVVRRDRTAPSPLTVVALKAAPSPLSGAAHTL